MPKSRYSEEDAVQKPAGELLASMGWDVFYCFDEEILGTDGTLGRYDYEHVLLDRYLDSALLELNEWLDEEKLQEAKSTLESSLATDSLLQTNEKKYKMLRDGIPVEMAREDGTSETFHAQVFDFEHPERNHFVAAEELWVQSPLYKRRCDLVGFVNGVPLVFVEFKRHDKDVRNAYNDNYSDYQDTIPQIFYFNAFVILSNGLESRIGTLGSSYEFFHEWKRLDEGDDVGSVALETMLKGVCSKKNFMDLLENFILFDHGHEPAAKILARNHQFLGVNKAYQAFENREINEGKLGVFWHTQGSGKSYSMVFIARKIKRRSSAVSPTFLVLTDRDELDTQIYETFESCECLGGVSSKECIASSGADLLKKLGGNPAFIFSLIHKFNDSDADPIRPNHDIIILSDEAHRTNNGIYADNMARILPDASKIGFTGTPLLENDNLTARTFGGYLSIYDFKRAVEDGATVPLYYENHSDMLGIENPDISEELLSAVEKMDVDENQAEKLERDLSREVHILMSKPRLESVARDFVSHYSSIWQCGKAMFVCVNKVTCVMMYDLVQKLWAEQIAHEKAKLSKMAQQEALEHQRKIDWMESTEMCVVVSQEQNEIARFNAWGLDIKPHREKMEKRKLDDEFKDRDNQLRIVFVCAMWLTGFDVKSLGTMYFDKPMKAHTLMQAIARANRVDQGKSNGLIVDYVGIVKAMRKALADYTNTKEGTGTDPVVDKEKLLAKIASLTVVVEQLLLDNDFDLGLLMSAKGFDKISAVKDGANAVCGSQEQRKRFCIVSRELFKMYKFTKLEEVGLELWQRRDALRAIYNELMKKVSVADTTERMVELQGIVDSCITVTSAQEERKASTKFDISGINFDKLRNEFAKVQRKELLLEDFSEVLEERIEDAMKRNPLRADYYKRYESIIDSYNAEQDKATIERTFLELMKLSEELDEKQKSYIKEGFAREDQQAVFELMFKDELSKTDIAKTKALAIELADVVEARLAEMVRWTEKDQTRNEVLSLIRNELWSGLPEESYPDDDLPEIVQKVYGFYYTKAIAA